MHNLTIRKAKPADIRAISAFTRGNQKVMLFRAPAEIKKLLPNYLVALNDKDDIVGCCGFKTYPGGDAEIISLAVDYKHQGRGTGDKLIKRAISEISRKKNLKRILALTTPEVSKLFRKNNFLPAGIQLFHEKILEDCKNCPRNRLDKNGSYLCNEVALIYSKKK